MRNSSETIGAKIGAYANCMPVWGGLTPEHPMLERFLRDIQLQRTHCKWAHVNGADKGDIKKRDCQLSS